MSSYTGYRHSLVKTKLLRADLPDRGILQKITRSLLKGAQEPYQKSFNLCQPSLGHLQNASKGKYLSVTAMHLDKMKSKLWAFVAARSSLVIGILDRDRSKKVQ